MALEQTYRATGDYRQYLEDPVFHAARRVAIRCGLCACGQPATEVVHVQMPPRFMYTTPDKLRPVCDACYPTEAAA